MRENEMREILFRGKRKDNGEWIYGMLISFPAGKSFILSKETLLRCKYCDIDIVSCIILPETRGEYTGLTDKNGVKIFEGDIIKTGDSTVCSVEWDGENARYLGFTAGKERRIVYVGREPKAEVIGNLHDNPELLKGSDKEYPQ